MKSSLPKMTKAEIARVNGIIELGCPCCATLGFFRRHVKFELHHILQGGKRMGHWYTIYLCAGHHQGHWAPWQREEFPKSLMAQALQVDVLVSIASGRKAFARIYGTERDIWQKNQTLLNLNDDWPPSKIFKRSAA